MRTRSSRWPLSVVLLASLLAIPTVLMAQAAETDAPASTRPVTSSLALLRAIPGDATAFIAIRNLKEIDGDIVGIAGQLGFPMGPEGMFPAPLEWLKQALQITGGLNENGGIALVLLNVKTAKTLDELQDRVVLFVPASDPKALLKSLNAEETNGGVYKFDLAGSPSVAIVKGDFLIATKAPAKDAPAPTALADAAKAEGEGIIKSMSPDRVQAYAKQDVLIWLNLQNVSDDLRKQMSGLLTETIRGVSGRGASSKPAEEEGQEIVKKLNAFVEQGDEAAVGIVLGAKLGACFSVYVKAKADTQLANTIAAQVPSKDPLLAGLPNEPLVFAGGMIVAPTAEGLAEMRKTLDQLAAKAAELDPDKGSPLNPTGLKPLIDTYMRLMENTTRGAVLVSNLAAAPAGGRKMSPGMGMGEKSAPGEKPGKAASAEKKEDKGAAASDDKTADGAIGLTIIVETKDSKAWKTELKKSFDQIKDVVGGVAKADGKEKEKVDQTMSGFTWKENAGTVAGASVDTMQVELDKLPNTTPEAITQVKAVVGSEGILFRIATVDEKHVVVTLGGGESRLAEIIPLVQKGQTPLLRNRSITKIAGRMPAGGPKVNEAYVDLAQLIDLVKAIATRVGTQLPLNITLTNSAPLAIATVGIGSNAQEFNVLIPIELIKSGYTAVMQAFMGAMGGGMGGGPAMGGTDGSGGSDQGSGEGATPKPKPRPRKPQPE